MDADSIQGMKYSELQKLAKSLGIKANMKIDKLKTALVAHYENDGKKDEKPQEKIDITSEDVEMTEQPEERKPVKKGKRRGRTAKTTKKMVSQKSADVTDNHPPTPISTLARLATPKSVHRPGKLGTTKAVSGKLSGTPKLGTPKAVFRKSFGTPKIGTPKAMPAKLSGTSNLGTPKAASAKSPGTPSLGTPKAASAKSPGTPSLGTPKAASGTPKSAGKPKQQVASLKVQSHKSPIVGKKRSVERTSLSTRHKSPIVGKKRSVERKSLSTRHKSPIVGKKRSVERKSSSTKHTPKSPLTNSQSKQPNKRKLSQTETENPKNTKRRRSTFEVMPLPESVSEEPRPSSRRSTFEVKPEAEKTISPGVTEMLGSMKCNMNSEEMKKSLLNVIDQKVQKKVKDKESESTSKHTSGIPRFAAFLAQKKEQENKKPVTPGSKNWTKIHKREFDKMDSIDVYLKKKKARQEEYAASAKKTKSLLEETKAAINKLKSHKTPTIISKQTKSSLFQSPAVAVQKNVPFKPSVMSTANMDLNFASQSRKSPRIAVPVFKPTVMSTTDINFNFGKTPTTLPRRTKSVMENGSTAPRKSPGAANKSFVTPFRFNATLNNTLNETKSVKKTFDLQSSLAKPITWKAHKGKLKPIAADPVYTKPQQDHNVSVKTPTVKQTRENRRAAAAKKRANDKFSKQMSRRGIKAQ